MEEYKTKIICSCGEKTVQDAVEILKGTDLPYKKAKKLVTGCNKTCCRRPLMSLFNMVEFGEIDYEEIFFLIDQMNARSEA
jgi:DNA-directed RNA polymerase subunit N (RpoN/RPB10)